MNRQMRRVVSHMSLDVGMSLWKLAKAAHTTTAFAAARGIGVVLVAMTAHISRAGTALSSAD